MLTMILKVKVDGLESTQIFLDDVSGAIRELQYWNAEGKEVEVTQITETTDRLQ